MKRRLLAGLASAALLTSAAVPVVNNSFLINSNSKSVQASALSDAFLDKVALQAEKSAKKYGLYTSLMLAQAALESGWGQSGLAVNANNLFGMKAGIGWTGQVYTSRTAEQTSGGKTYYINAPFRKYNSYEDSFDDYGLKMRTTMNGSSLRYKNVWLENAETASAAAVAVKAAGYATDVNYASKLQKNIATYDLTKYDPTLSNSTYTAVVAEDTSAYAAPTDHSVTTPSSTLTKGEKVTVTKTYTYYDGSKRMYLQGKGWVDGSALKTASSQAPSTNSNTDVPSTGQTRTLMHNAYIYTSEGTKSSKGLQKAGITIDTYGTVTLNGATYYRVNSASEDQFIKASNIDGTKRTLTHNAYVYDKDGQRVASSDKLLKGTDQTTYGSSKKINGKKFYIIGDNKYVKRANFR